MKCLVVDESTTMRRILSNAARDAGCDEIVEAADGAEALERWDAGTKIVMTGWLTPEMSGPELVRRLRAKTEAGGVRVLMVTSRDRAQQVEEAKAAGVDAYLVKPAAAVDLVRKLRELGAGSDRSSDDRARGNTPAGSTEQANADSLDRAA